MSTITSAEERDMIEAVQKTAAYVTSGSSPDDAVEKVAREHGFGPGRIRLVAQAYNTGRQLDQLQQHTNILDKLASFPLADPDVVIERIYNKEKKAAEPAVHRDYDRPPTWLDTPRRMKAAAFKIPTEVPPSTPESREKLGDVHRAFSKTAKHRQTADELRRQAAAAEDTVRFKLASLVEYLKCRGQRLPFAEIEAGAHNAFGKMATAGFLDIAYARAKLTEKRASADDYIVSKVLDPGKAPFTIIGAAVKAARECVRLRGEAKIAADATATAHTEAFRPFELAGVPSTEESQPSPWCEKAAGILGTPAMGAFVGSMMSRGLGGVPKSRDDLVDDAVASLDDPDHMDELRKIQANAMLSSLLSDPEDPISSHDPDSVLNAYNEITQIAPRTADSMATLRPLLRRRLEGNVQPFEANEMLNIEKGLKANTPNTNIMGSGNASNIFG